MVISDGLACFRAVTEVGCLHQAVVVKGRYPNELPEFRWINTVLSNLKTSSSGTFHALRFDKYPDRYLGAFNYRFNRRFNLGEMTERGGSCFLQLHSTAGTPPDEREVCYLIKSLYGTYVLMITVVSLRMALSFCSTIPQLRLGGVTRFR